MNTTPFLDSIKYKFKAISSSSFTYPSVASLLTGLYPHNHGAIIEGELKNTANLKNYNKIKDNMLSLSEILYFAGYNIYFSTAIDLAAFPFEGRIIPRIFTFEKCEKLFNNFKRWISRKREPFFAYIHLGDLHAPINPPKKFKNIFYKIKKIPKIEKWDYQRIEEQKGSSFREYKKNRVMLYDSTIRYIDFSIKNLFKFLESKNLIKSTIIIITADHGEEFWEHSELESRYFFDQRGFYGTAHGHNVFNEIIEVPIIISCPNLPLINNPLLNTLKSNVDIMPTILKILNIVIPYELDGNYIFKYHKNRELLTESMAFGYEKKALIYNNLKLIYSKLDNINWVFDLRNDPNEKKPMENDVINNLLLNKLLSFYSLSEKRNIKTAIKNIKI